MIHTERFLISQRPYAIDLSGMVLEQRELSCYVQLNAVWFRRRKRAVSACLGYLWDYQDQRPATPQEAAERHGDGRYGGHCLARLDPTGYWAEGGASPEVIARHLEILEPMLAAVGEVPAGYSGWWHF